MTFVVKLGLMLLAGTTLLFSGLAARAQATQTPADAPSPKPAEAKSAAQKFPFPTDTGKPAPPVADAPDSAASAQTANPSQQGDAGQQEAKQGSAAKRFPFPGENPGDAPGTADLPGLPAAPPKPAQSADDGAGFSSSSAQSGGPDGSNAQPPLNAEGSSGDAADTGTHGHRRFVARPVHQMTPEEREADDLDVAGFYLNDHNYKGAYARAVEAVSLKPDDAYAQIALGEAARGMNKPEEARAAFARVLQLDADPKQKKQAQKALEDLGPK